MVLGAAAVLFAAIFVLRQTSDDVADTIALLYVIPITLVALELGLIAGITAAAFALLLLGVGAITSHADLEAVGFTTRGVAYLAVGGAAGRFSERMRDIQRRQALLLRSGLAMANTQRAEDLPATLAQSARTLLGARGARAELIDRAAVQSGELGGSPERVPIETRGVRYGTLAVGAGEAVNGEDRVTLEILALQGAVASESQRLLEDARQGALLRTELHDARSHLAERGHQLRTLITRQEAERHQVSDELHEQAAQTLAGVLLGLRALERELESDLAAPQLGTLRSNVDSTLHTLRSLAVSLRPPVLELGLEAALQALVADAREDGLTEMTVAFRDIGDLSSEAQTIVYRVIEEALDALGGARFLAVRAEPDDGELVIVVDGGVHPIARERLALLRARLEILRGTLSASTNGLRAVIQL